MIIWTCDFRENTGEGKLARLYVQTLKQKNQKKIKILSPDYDYSIKTNSFKKIKKKKKIDYNSIYSRYIYPIIGCFYSWYYYFLGRKFIYVNYLPLWNILLFLFLAPRSQIGPITGSTRSDNNLLRKVFPFLFIISVALINLRFKKLILATNNLNDYFVKSNVKIQYNFVKIYLKKIYKKKKKKFDIIIYFRNHSNKNYKSLTQIINCLLKKKITICCIGDYLKISGVKNFGFLNNKKALQIISQSKLGINTSENFYTFFMMDCLNNSTLVVCDKNSFFEKRNLNKNILLSNYSKTNITCNKIYNFLSKSKFNNV